MKDWNEKMNQGEENEENERMQKTEGKGGGGLKPYDLIHTGWGTSGDARCVGGGRGEDSLSSGSRCIVVSSPSQARGGGGGGQNLCKSGSLPRKMSRSALHCTIYPTNCDAYCVCDCIVYSRFGVPGSKHVMWHIIRRVFTSAIRFCAE